MSNIIDLLQQKGFVCSTLIDQKEVFHLTVPCKVRILSDTILNLKSSYLPNEETGGLLWAKPTTEGSEKIYIVDDVTYVRNAIEDKPRTDGLTKAGAYLPDTKEFYAAIEKIFQKGYLPIDFHTHPSQRKSINFSIANEYLKNETSDADRFESNVTYPIGGRNLLLPRALITGNFITGQDIFIGLYNGGIAPVDFETTKEKVRERKMENMVKKAQSIEFSPEAKLAFAIAALLLIILIIRYPKQSLAGILAVAAIGHLLLSTQNSEDNPDYFTMLSDGNAEINLPAKE